MRKSKREGKGERMEESRERYRERERVRDSSRPKLNDVLIELVSLPLPGDPHGTGKLEWDSMERK